MPGRTGASSGRTIASRSTAATTRSPTTASHSWGSSSQAASTLRPRRNSRLTPGSRSGARSSRNARSARPLCITSTSALSAGVGPLVVGKTMMSRAFSTDASSNPEGAAVSPITISTRIGPLCERSTANSSSRDSRALSGASRTISFGSVSGLPTRSRVVGVSGARSMPPIATRWSSARTGTSERPRRSIERPTVSEITVNSRPTSKTRPVITRKSPITRWGAPSSSWRLEGSRTCFVDDHSAPPNDPYSSKP